MNEGSRLYRCFRIRRIVDHRMTDVAVIGDDLSVFAYVVAVVTTETTREIQMADIVRVRLPIRLHLRKEISLKDALHFGDRAIDGLTLLRINIGIVLAIELGEAGGNIGDRLRCRIVRPTQNLDRLLLQKRERGI